MVRHWLRGRERGLEALGGDQRGGRRCHRGGPRSRGVGQVHARRLDHPGGRSAVRAGMAAIRRHYLWVASRLRQVPPGGLESARPASRGRCSPRARASTWSGPCASPACCTPTTWRPGTCGNRETSGCGSTGRSATPTSRSRVIDAGRRGGGPTLRRHVRKVNAANRKPCSPWWSPRKCGARRWRHAFAHRDGGPSDPAGPSARSRGWPWPTSTTARRPPRRTGPAPTARSPWSAGAWCAWPAPPSTSGGSRGRHRAAGRDHRPGLRSHRSHPAGGAVRLHRLPRGGASAARGDRTGAAGPGRGRLGPARGQGAPGSGGEPLPRPDHHGPGATWTRRRGGPGTRPCSTWSSRSSWSPRRLGKLLHNQSALWIRAALYADTRIAVTSVPWVLEESPAEAPAATQ